jgi:hypothetical protein
VAVRAASTHPRISGCKSGSASCRQESSSQRRTLKIGERARCS